MAAWHSPASVIAPGPELLDLQLLDACNQKKDKSTDAKPDEGNGTGDSVAPFGQSQENEKIADKVDGFDMPSADFDYGHRGCAGGRQNDDKSKLDGTKTTCTRRVHDASKQHDKAGSVQQQGAFLSEPRGMVRLHLREQPLRLIVRPSAATRRALCGLALLLLVEFLIKALGVASNVGSRLAVSISAKAGTNMLLVAAGGAAAQLVDGSLGMGYGLTSSTVLMAAGVPPAIASASVHFAELGTTVVSGIAHHHFGNVDWRITARLAPAGALGAFLGAKILSSLSMESARPFTSALLLALGVVVLYRFASGKCCVDTRASPPRGRMLVPLGCVGGFIDATGGGGWGPCCTPALLATGSLAPATVIGIVSVSEFVVAAAASAGFLSSLGGASVRLDIVCTLLAGGVVAAPLAAGLVKCLPPRALGVAAGIFICATNLRALAAAVRDD
eukprot:4003279-Pleurochrysis_carterae.AAC.1